MIAILLFVLGIVLGYLSGSLCSAVIVSRLFALPDPRVGGSKNPGATNVLRLSGAKYAIMVLIADGVKGMLPVLVMKLLGADMLVLGFTCLAAVLGHMYPMFFDFRGGKGVATAIGSFFGLHFMLGVVVTIIWLLVANFTRYSSFASILSLCLAPLLIVFAPHGIQALLPLFFIAVFVLYKHRENITRLLDGTEYTIRFRKDSLDGELEGVVVEQLVEEFAEKQYRKDPSAPKAPPRKRAKKE